MHACTALLVFSALAVTACKGQESDGAPTPATSGTAASGACPAGAYSNAEGGFCILLPEGSKPGAVETRTGFYPKEIRFEGPERATIVVTWGAPLDSYDQGVAGLKALGTPRPEREKEKSLGIGDLPSGKGFYYHKTFGNGIDQGESLIKGSKHLVRCYVNATTEKAPKLVEACKTLSPS